MARRSVRRPIGSKVSAIDALAVEGLGKAPGFGIVLIASRAIVEAAFFQQAPDRVVVKVRAAFVFVFQRNEAAELVPAIAQGLLGGVDAFGDKSRSGVAPGGAAFQAIGMGQQTTFGVAAKAFFGLVRVLDQDQLAGFVFVRRCCARPDR